MEEQNRRIRIPYLETGGDNPSTCVELFPDELPLSTDLDHNDLVDCLRSELAPLHVWRSCAVEYHRQGCHFEFEAILNEIVESLLDEQVLQSYSSKDNFKEGMTDIYSALAANSLANLSRSRDKKRRDEYATQLMEYFRKAEYYMRVNEYIWLIKGFYHLHMGEFKHAEDIFKAIHDRATKNNALVKKKFLFGALVGLGIVAYCLKKYVVSLDDFIKAVSFHPKCDASVRVAIAACCFKLEQFDRARAALDRVMSLDPSNADALTVLALLDQVEAQKSAEASQRGRLRANAYEYCMLAASIDSTCCTALNHMANYCSHIWKTVSSHRIRKGEKGNARYDLSECAVVSSERVIATKKAGVKDVTLCQGDHIRVRLLDVERNDKHGHAFIECSIESVASVDGGSKGSDSRNTIEGPKLTLSIELPSHFVGKPVLVDTKEMGRAIKLANEAISNSQVGGVKAEGYYIVGKVHHAQGNIDSALLCYRKSLEFEDLMLAAFGVATIQLVKGDYEKSLGLFERVLAAHPTDKDTLAYCILLRALHRQESEDFDKVKEVAPGFQFEIDMWLLQGQTRLKKPQEYFTALKCYNTALECMRLKGIAADPMIYSNVAVLYHSLGKLNQALEYSKRALTAVEDSIVKSPDKDDAYTNPPFRNADLEGVFYKWSSPVCALVLDDASTEDADAASPSVGRFLVDRGEGAAEVDLTLAVTTGDDVVIGDVVYTVESVEASKLTARSPVHRLMRHSAADKTFTFQYKELWHNFGDDYVTLSYNLARIMEDAGLTRAAMEVYAELLKKHASFMECYLRLSRIERDLGKFDEASRWLSKALAVNDEQPDINISLGDLYSQGSSWEAAKRCYEKVCGKNRHDARAMLSLGNFYYTTLRVKDEKYEQHLKDSYKYFFHVLNEDRKDAFAAVGLGMVCAEKQELEVAREIFARARESEGASSFSEDVCINLAHCHLAQGRLVDAEHLYQATLKSMTKLSHVKADKMLSLCEVTGLAQFKARRHEDSIRSILRALHYDPSCFRCWYNSAVVRGDYALSSIKRSQRITSDIESASEELNIAQRVFSFSARMASSQGRGLQYDRHAAEKHAQICEVNKSVFVEHLEAAREEEAKRERERQQKEAEHAERKRQKDDERRKKEEEHAELEKKKQEIALQRSKKLEELREKWVSMPVKESRSEGAGGAKRKKKGAAKGADENDYDDEDVYKKASSLGDNIDFGDDSEEEAEFDDGKNGAGDSAGSADEDLQHKAHQDLFGSDDEGDGAASAKPKRSGKGRRKGGTHAGRKRKSQVNYAESDEDDDLDLDSAPNDGGARGGGGRLKRRKDEKVSGGLSDDDDDAMDIWNTAGADDASEAADSTAAGEVKRKSRIMMDDDEDDL